jgi:Ca2+-binding RTX toxin-like protein
MSFLEKYNGRWEGVGYQLNNGQTWSAVITITEDTVFCEFPSLNGGGYLSPIAISDGTFIFNEVITYNGSVLTGVSLRLYPYVNGDLGFEEYTPTKILSFVPGGLERTQGDADTIWAETDKDLTDYTVPNLTFIGADNANGAGTAANNALTGNSGNNHLSGLEGNDTLDGGLGADTLQGGAGNDAYRVDSPDDIVIEIPGQGLDTVTSSVTHTLAANVEKLILSGTETIHGTGNNLDNSLIGNTKANILKGLGGDDTLIGNAGPDKLYGGLGNDTLTGGQGIDRFTFDTAPNASANIDTLKDFSPGTDKIVLDDDIFTLGVTGAGAGVALPAEAFRLGVTALGDSDRIIYDQSTGRLYYDADGHGTTANPIQFALLGMTTHPALSAVDILVTA